MGTLMETTKVNLVTAKYRGSGAESEYFTMGTPRKAFYADTLHTIAINTRETEFGSIVEPVPITLKTYKPYQSQTYGYPQQVTSPAPPVARARESDRPTSAKSYPSPVKEAKDDIIARPPPKKKWIKEYLEEEPKSPVSVRVVTGVAVTARSNGVVRPTTPVPPAASAPAPAVIVYDPPPAPAVIPPSPAVIPPAPVVIPPAPAVIPPAPIHDFVQEHSRARTSSNSHGLPQIPSPPSASSSGSGSSGCAPRAGTREVHNKLEKNRRAHLKECFELLKRQLPATSDDKKTSNLSILGSAIRYIQVLRRKERECEHEMERLAREKIAAQQRLAALRREVSVRTSSSRPRNIDGVDEKDAIVNDQILGIPISITSSPPRSASQMESSPPHTLNLSTKLRTLPIQITPTSSQVVRTSYGARHHNTLTLTTLAPAESNTQNGQIMENGITNTLSTTTLVHPAQIHLPLSQMVGSGGLVVGPAALQLLSAGGGLRVLQAPAMHTNGIVSSDNSRITKENGLVSTAPVSTEGGSVVVSGLTPLVMSQPGTHLLQTHTLTHKMVETQVVKGGGNVAPLTVSTQYLSSTTIVKPVVMVSSAHSPPAPST